MDIDDADDRVVCYDAVMETMESSPAPASTAPAPPDRTTKQTNNETKNTEEKTREITASIIRVTELARGNIQIMCS